MRQVKLFGSQCKEHLSAHQLPGAVAALPLLAAIGIGSVVLVAAYGKMFFPSEELAYLDYSVSIFEVIFLSFLWMYWNRKEMWLATSMVFASWGGYSLFWFLAELPCTCMGEAVSIPKGFTLVLDALFFLISMSLAYFLGLQKRKFLFCICNAGIFFAVGYVFAKWVFKTLLLD